MTAPAPRQHPSYKDSVAYRRSIGTRPDGQPTFPLAFIDRPRLEPRQSRKRAGLRIVAALLVCAAVAVVMDRVEGVAA